MKNFYSKVVSPKLKSTLKSWLETTKQMRSMLATDNEYYREKLEIDSDKGKQIGISTV